MNFPPKPATDDERRSELLRLMSVRGYPRVYVLGCFARYVTIYAQQVRALNLVDALVRSGVLSARSRVAVVGGGIAGLTAAAAAAVRGVARVQVFEQASSTMRLQRTSAQRYVHPFIYDWPDADTGADTGLPVMNWAPDTAADVVERLDREWARISAAVGDRLPAPRLSCGEVHLAPGAERPRLRAGDGAEEEWDAVILAVGFGSDAAGDQPGYWNDTSIDGPDVRKGGTWLVSGAGDGGLTDLMRLCVESFRHERVLSEVEAGTREAVRTLLLEAEREAAEAARGARSPAELLAARHAVLREPYDRAVAIVGQTLEKSLPPRGLGTVILVAAEQELVAGGASVLNRLIVRYLHDQGRFHLREGRLRGVPKSFVRGEVSRYRVYFEGSKKPLTCDHVLVRHGPRSALEQGFPDVARRCRGLRRTWAAARQHEDWTRDPMYDPRDFTPGETPGVPLRVDFAPDAGAVVVSGPTPLSGQTLRSRVEDALSWPRPRTAAVEGRKVDPQAVELRVQDVFASATAYERAVRALCTAEIAVFDLTGYAPSVMVLLGIRAAVRRGVTITVTQDDLASLPLPFNVAALNPIRLRGTDVFQRIATAVDEGIRGLRSDPDAYLDLPAFDALRQTGEYRTIPATREILFLCWFNDAYRNHVAGPLEQRFGTRFWTGERAPGVVTTLDSRSPQLIEQRLYGLIRRAQLCVVDWTGYRPNVFFELGVRLAVSSIDPFGIVYRTLPDGHPQNLSTLLGPAAPDEPADAALLRAFFQPIPFDVEDRPELSAALDEFARDGVVRLADAALSPGRTYQVVSEALHRAQEPGGRTVDALLAGEAERLAGPAVPEEGELPVLFGEALSAQVHGAAVDYLAAAWFYLEGTYRLCGRGRGSLASEDPLLKVGKELLDRLQNVAGRAYEELANEVAERLVEREPRPDDTEAVGYARWLKGRALALRRAEDWSGALHALSRAESLLQARAVELRAARRNGDESHDERDVLGQLPHVLGSMGGVLRAMGGTALRASARVYDEGFAMEQRVEAFGIPASYNLVQRLIARALLDPLAVDTDAEVEGLALRTGLRSADAVISDQLVRGRGGDVYAAADLALVRTVLGSEAWEDAVERFLKGPPAPNAYALRVTREVMDQLAAACATAGDEARALADRLRFAREEITIELNGTE